MEIIDMVGKTVENAFSSDPSEARDQYHVIIFTDGSRALITPYLNYDGYIAVRLEYLDR